MSIITEKQLTTELKRLVRERQTPGAEYVEVEEVIPERISFYARIGERTEEFTITLAEAMSAPLSYISETYLAPLLTNDHSA